MAIKRTSTPSAPKVYGPTKDIKPTQQKPASESLTKPVIDKTTPQPLEKPTTKPVVDPKTGKTVADVEADARRKKAQDVARFKKQADLARKKKDKQKQRAKTQRQPHVTKDIKVTDPPKITAVPELGTTLPAEVTTPLFVDPDAAIKAAPVDTVLFADEPFSENLLIDLLFEDIGGQELINLSRHDTVNGQDVVYQPIKNLGILQETYNPTNMLQLQDTSDKYFANFIIDLRLKLPKVGNGEDGKNYYINSSGDLLIEFINLKSDEQIEVQITSGGTMDETGI